MLNARKRATDVLCWCIVVVVVLVLIAMTIGTFVRL